MIFQTCMAVMVILNGFPWKIFVNLSGRSGIDFPTSTATQLPVTLLHFLGAKIHTLHGDSNTTGPQGRVLGSKLSLSTPPAV